MEFASTVNIEFIVWHFSKRICIKMFLATYMYYKSCLNMFYILITTKPWYKLYTSDERSIWLSTRYFDADSVFWAACSLLNRFLLSLSVDNFNRLYTHHIPEFVNKFIKFLGHPSFFKVILNQQVSSFHTYNFICNKCHLLDIYHTSWSL